MNGIARVLAAADELAVGRFLCGEMSFADIPRLVERALDTMPGGACDSIDAVFASNEWVCKTLSCITHGCSMA